MWIFYGTVIQPFTVEVKCFFNNITETAGMDANIAWSANASSPGNKKIDQAE